MSHAEHVDLLAHANVDDAMLDVVGETFLERLCDHRDLVLGVGGLRKALERRRLDHRFAEAYDWIGNFDVQLQ